jgi:hypothetical protein
MKISQDLEKIIAYLSSRGSGLKLEALELEVYRQGDLEMVVPHRHGQLAQPQATASGRRDRTLEEILETCADLTKKEHSQT